MATKRYHRDVLWPRVRERAWATIRQHGIHNFWAEAAAFVGTTVASMALTDHPGWFSLFIGFIALVLTLVFHIAGLWIYCDWKAASEIAAELHAKCDALRSEKLQLQHALSARPRDGLAVRIDEVMCSPGAEYHVKKHGPCSLMTLTVSIRNTGPPMAAEYSAAAVTVPGQPATKAILIHLESPVQMFASCEFDGSPIILPDSLRGQSRVIAPDQQLHELAIRPIDPGGMIRGYQIFVVKGLSRDDIMQKGTRIEVTYKDISGTTVTGFEVLGITTHDKEPHAEFRHYPV